MRGLEQDIKSYVKAKTLNLKEDVLAGNATVTRTVKVLVEVVPMVDQESWTIRIQGKVDDEKKLGSTKFLRLFERVKIEFRSADSDVLYMPVQWTQNKN